MKSVALLLLLQAPLLTGYAQGTSDREAIPAESFRIEAADTAVLPLAASKEAKRHVYGVGDLLVQDHAQVLSPSVRQSLEAKLEEYAHTRKIEFAVVTVASLHGRDVATVGDSIKNALGVGNRTTKMGLLYLIAPAEHKQSLRVGRGLEPYLGDGEALRILNKTKPKPSQDIEQAIVNRVDATLAMLAPDLVEIQDEQDRVLADEMPVAVAYSQEEGWPGFLLAMLCFGGAALFMALAASGRFTTDARAIQIGEVEEEQRGSWRARRILQRRRFKGRNETNSTPSAGTHSSSGNDLATGMILGSMLDSADDSTKSSSSSSSSFDWGSDSSSSGSSFSFGGDSDTGGGGASSSDW